MKVDNEFIRRYTGVVECIVRQYGKVNNQQDLMQEGFIGLIEAAKRYDPSTGVRFESYASWWVRKYIREHIIRYGQAVSLPSNTKDIFEHITEDIDATRYEEDGDVITFADCIADETDTDEEREQQQFERLHKAIEELPKREQTIIRQMYGIGCKKIPQKQIAQQLGIAPVTVWRIHEKILKKCKKMHI